MKNFWTKSLMARLVSYFSLLSFLTVSLVGTVAFIRARSALKTQIADRLSVIATLKEDALNLWVDNQREATVSLAQLSEVRSQTEILFAYPKSDPRYRTAYALLSQYLTSAVTSRPELQEIFILTEVGGQIVLSTDKSREGEYQVKNRYFIQGRENTFVQNVYPSPTTGKPTMTISTPLYSQKGQRLGVLAAHLNLERMDRIILERTGLGKNGETYLVDRFNLFVSGERFGRQEFPRGVHTTGIDAALQGFDSVGIYQNYRNIPVIGVYRWLDKRELALLVEMNVSEAFAPARQLAGTIFFTGLSAAGVLTIGVYLLARQIARPILAITRTATQVASGDLSAIAPTLTEDEVGVLARTFNQMTEQLKSSHEQLADYSRSLEQKANQLEQSLTEVHSYQAQLVQSEKMSSLGQLVAGIAHEINNPVSFIQGNIPHATIYVQDLLQLIYLYQQHYPNPQSTIKSYQNEIDFDFIKEDLPKLLDSMKIGADRIRQIVLSLRNFSRLDESERKPVNLHEGIENTLLILQHRLKARGDFPEILVIKNYGDLPKVECYAGQLNQVLMNLLANAIDALEERAKFQDKNYQQSLTQYAPRIWIQTDWVRNLDKGRLQEAALECDQTDTVMIKIADNGLGIPESIQARLFDPFFTTKPVGKGTGLGLSISYKVVVDKHKGKLYFHSAPGKGTEFTIEIPVQ